MKPWKLLMALFAAELTGGCETPVEYRESPAIRKRVPKYDTDHSFVTQYNQGDMPFLSIPRPREVYDIPGMRDFLGRLDPAEADYYRALTQTVLYELEQRKQQDFIGDMQGVGDAMQRMADTFKQMQWDTHDNVNSALNQGRSLMFDLSRLVDINKRKR